MPMCCEQNSPLLSAQRQASPSPTECLGLLVSLCPCFRHADHVRFVAGWGQPAMLFTDGACEPALPGAKFPLTTVGAILFH